MLNILYTVHIYYCKYLLFILSFYFFLVFILYMFLHFGVVAFFFITFSHHKYIVSS